MMDRLRGCLGSYGSPIFPSKADRIMSRYRPIAPKPAAIPCGSDVERSASSAVTFDNLCIRQVPDTCVPQTPSSSKQKSKRARKRSSKESEVHQPATKRPAPESSSSWACEKPQPLRGVSYGLATEAAPMLIQEDAGFMERAAASAPSSVFPLEKTRKVSQSNSGGYGGCFTEMIRGIAGLSTANHVYNLLQQQHQQQHHHHESPNFLSVPPQRVASSIGQQSESQREGEAVMQFIGSTVAEDFLKEERCSDAFWSHTVLEGAMIGPQNNAGERAFSEEPQQSGLDEEENDGGHDQRKRVVTLNLLPEAPTRVDSPTQSTCSTNFSQTSLPCTSLARIEQAYGESLEPVVLVDDASHKVLWVNQGYLKACSRGNSSMRASFADPLGAPSQIGQFQLQLEGRPEHASGTLWGFPEKLMLSRTSMKAKSNPGFPCPPQQHSDSAALGRSSSCSLDCSKVITPQPIRLVGSVVSIESITEIQNGEAASGTLEHVKSQLEESNLPGLITDILNVVRWVNTAYKVMVGQPECPWLISTMKEGAAALGSPTITGEVLLSCNVEVPKSAMSFSGRVNVQWGRNTGERSCMTLPCDVSAVTVDHSKRMLIWRFDIQASLSLTCGIGK